MSKKTDSDQLSDSQLGEVAKDAPPIIDADLHNAIDQAATPEPTEVRDDGVPPPPATDAETDPLAAITAERDALKDQLLRALADTENMRRRSEREAETARKYGHTQFARDLVGAIDNLARALQSAPEDKTALDESVQSLLTGIELSWTEIQTAIEKHGVRQINPLGEKFDYNFHQAMFEVPTNDQPAGLVLEGGSAWLCVA
jgi:molecular chaperone GrpE